MDYLNQNSGKKKKTKTKSNSLKSKKSGGNFGKKIINSVQKGGFSKSDFVGGNFYQLEYNKKISIFYYLTDEGFGKTDTYKFANKRTRKGLENHGGLDAYVYLYNLYGTHGGYLEAVELASITDLLMLTEFDFQNLVLTGSDEIKYNFQGANLKGANFANAILKHVHFNNAELENANFENATLDELSFYEAQLQNANFENAQLDIVDFSDAKLQNAKLKNVTLLGYQNVSFSDADLTNAKIELLEKGSDNTSMDIFKGAILERADLRKTMLESANLQGVNLRGSNLQGANLSGANLLGADLSGANLSGANLSGANLSGAILDGVIIHDAIFTNAIINQELKKAINNKKALVKSNDFIKIPETNNIYKRNKKVIPNNSNANANDYRKTLEKLAFALYKKNILPQDRTEIIDRSVINLLQAHYTSEISKRHNHIKNAIKVVRIFLLRIQFKELEDNILSNNF